MMGQGKEKTIMEDSMSENVMLQSKQKNRLSNKKTDMESITKRTTPITLT